ncbi:hypothetical protein [Halomonas halophila]
MVRPSCDGDIRGRLPGFLSSVDGLATPGRLHCPMPAAMLPASSHRPEPP